MSMKMSTKMRIEKPVQQLFEAFVNPEIMANYWFSSKSGRWEQGKTVILRYEEYNADVEIRVLELEENRRIVYQWGTTGEETVVTITLEKTDDNSTIIEIIEAGWHAEDEALLEKMLGNKEGWVFVLSCLKAYLEYGARLRGALLK